MTRFLLIGLCLLCVGAGETRIDQLDKLAAVFSSPTLDSLPFTELDSRFDGLVHVRQTQTNSCPPGDGLSSGRIVLSAATLIPLRPDQCDHPAGLTQLAVTFHTRNATQDIKSIAKQFTQTMGSACFNGVDQGFTMQVWRDRHRVLSVATVADLMTIALVNEDLVRTGGPKERELVHGLDAELPGRCR